MHEKVVNLYKRLLLVGRDYPGGFEQVRRKAKEEFMKHKDLHSEDDILRAVHRGRWYIRNVLVPVSQLTKYRAMKQRYGLGGSPPSEAQ